MTPPAAIKTFSASDASAKFADLLDAASSKPVGITRQGQLAAYLVSRSDFDAMISSIQELEDQLWLAKAELARKHGFVGSSRVKAIVSSLSDAENTQNEEAGINS